MIQGEKERAIHCLSSVHLVPVFDMPSAAQSLHQISETLRNTGQTPVMLVVAGLDALAENVVRATNPVNGTAMLSTILRCLMRLSRESASFLSVLLVNMRGIGEESNPLLQGPLQSSHVRGCPAPFPSVAHVETLLFPSLLMRTLDQGIDTHLLVAGTPPVIQVIKDRTGDGTGKWCPYALLEKGAPV